MMKRTSLALRVIASTLLAVFVTCLIFSVVAWRILSARVASDAEQESAFQSKEAVSRLENIDDLSRAQVESAMRILEEQSRGKGAASLKGSASIAGKTVPDLHLGNESQVLNFGMVDHVKELAGGTATLFVWDGSNFTRVTTNVLKPDGSRAVGTVLDPHGKAYAALVQGHPFSGVVDILGAPYITCYVPMLDANQNPVGAWYTGFRLDSIASLGKFIEDATILDHGAMALIKPSGATVFRGKHVTPEELEKARAHAEGWVTHEEVFPSWGYTVLTAYPKSDVTARLLRNGEVLAGAAVILVGVILVLQFVLLSHLVLRPVLTLTERLTSADLNTYIEIERKDEIGALANSFNLFVHRLRQAMFDVRDGSAATTAKSGEIRGISQTTKTSMDEQCHHAEEAAESVAQLSRDIATVSSHTLTASKLARAAAEAAREGGKLVSSAVTHIESLSHDTLESSTRIATLSEHARQIGSIVGVIEEIAAGTNLLALNASIEAARAGVHGRGFAVVAGEVRRLSERTAQATKQVSALISGITAETDQTADCILSACDRASEGATTVASLNTTFERIVQMVVDVNGRVEQIAQAANHEAQAATSVSGSIQQVATSARDSSNNADQVVSAAGDLLGTAHTLEDLVRQFQLRDLPQDYA